MVSLAVIILTKNERLHIERTVTQFAPLAPQIFVIDSGSSDGTCEIAAAHGALVLSNPWINHARQFQWALDNAPITADWVMRIDADEVVEADLLAELARELPRLPAEVTGVCLKRKHVFMGRWIRHGGRYPLILLRLWRRGKARMEQRWMDEHMLLLEGRTVTFEGGFADVNLNNLGYFIDKHNGYATLEAIEVVNQRLGLFPRDDALARSAGGQASLTRRLKEGVYNRIPFELSATAYFLLRYILQLGFLDGREGAIYHGLQGFWYRFLVGAKTLELERAIRGLDREAALQRLAEMTGHPLTAEVSAPSAG